MDDFLTRFVESFVGRVDGPMKFRMVLQPIMAIIFAVRDGHRDAHAGKPPYAWALFSNPDHRRDMLRDGWKSVGKIFILALVLDVVYQYIVMKWVYPVQAVMFAIILALVPYLVMRGPINRLFRWGSGN